MALKLNGELRTVPKRYMSEKLDNWTVNPVSYTKLHRICNTLFFCMLFLLGA